jgi:hypothetical protein
LNGESGVEEKVLDKAELRVILDKVLGGATSRLQYHKNDTKMTNNILKSIKDVQVFEDTVLETAFILSQQDDLTLSRRKRQASNYCVDLLNQQLALQSETAVLYENLTMYNNFSSIYQAKTASYKLKASTATTKLNRDSYTNLQYVYGNLTLTTQKLIEATTAQITTNEAKLIVIKADYQANCTTTIGEFL